MTKQPCFIRTPHINLQCTDRPLHSMSTQTGCILCAHKYPSLPTPGSTHSPVNALPQNPIQHTSTNTCQHTTMSNAPPGHPAHLPAAYSFHPSPFTFGPTLDTTRLEPLWILILVNCSTWFDLVCNQDIPTEHHRNNYVILRIPQLASTFHHMVCCVMDLVSYVKSSTTMTWPVYVSLWDIG